jgi:chromate transporter
MMTRQKEDGATSLAQFLQYFLRLGTVGFGGPIALVARMESDLVSERGWIKREDYLEGLAMASERD